MTRIQQNTLRRIVEAAIELMSERGFHRVSVQEVGKKAGICEKTVFRYFATKKSLLDEIIRYRAYASELKREFENGRTWNLDHDLKLAARLYFQETKAKRNAFRAYQSALDSVDTNGEDFLRDPRELHAFLCDYMTAMQKKGKVRAGDVRLMVRAFVNTLHGYMLMYCLNDDGKSWGNKVASMKLTIDLFIQGFSQTGNSVTA
ncbi:MAG: TetR/AcrR family transcriptional regulator [Akkermansia sp.]